MKFRLLTFGLIPTLFMFVLVVFPSPASAAVKTQAQIVQASLDFCGAGTGPIRTACRHGFQAGYKGTTTKGDACSDPSITDPDAKTRCQEGFDEGARQALADQASSNPGIGTTGGADTCGEGKDAIHTKINFNCNGKGNPILDLVFAIIRFLTIGVGVAIVIAIILSGIQYTTSEGNPEKTMAAKNHIQNAIIGLLVYIFSFALINFLVPGGLIG
jgi:hypothetical protein